MHGLVVQFYRGMEPMVQEKENVLRQSSLLPAGGEVNCHLYLMVVQL